MPLVVNLDLLWTVGIMFRYRTEAGRATAPRPAIGHAAIQQGYLVLYREAHILLEELADATLDGNRKQDMELLTTVPLVIIDDLGMRNGR